MADMKQIYNFAVKWCEKFENPNTDYIELVDHYMSDECDALGFKMDCGRAFSEKYGKAVDNSEALEKIIDQVDDISLLGSAIYSAWRYFNHWAYDGAEILNRNNRKWFIIALTRLKELSASQNDGEYTIILLPEFAALKSDVEKLRTEISMLLLEKDELRFVVCKNIETAYMLALGNLEYKTFELNCEVLRIKRKITIIQAIKNRQEKIVMSDIERKLDEEFAEYKQQLNNQIDKMNKAIEYSKASPLTEEETKELKKLYRNIVKALHPDLHPDVTTAQNRLFLNAVQAYKNGDLDTLRIISEMTVKPLDFKQSENDLTFLKQEKERLVKSLKLIDEQIKSIKSVYPYTMKDLVNDSKQIDEKKAELNKTIEELREVYDIYVARLKEILR